ncbi:MAG TPA: DMT family transporter [Acidimicrobiia bacterium]|jgi:drug/metabolite transporter (DMT)-like permease|nr:DMT family transporter [Acidimicrobiia bacterium]
MSSRVALATILSLLTALFYAISNVLELLEAEKVPDEFAMRPGLVLRLMRRPRWLVGLLADFGGYICHAAALGLATVVFVEPILATGILMSLFIGSAFVHRPVVRNDWIAAGVLSGGLALFLYEVSPTGGREIARTREWLVAGPSAVAAIAVCMALGGAMHGRPRAAFLGVAAGIAFGVSALLTKALVHYLGGGVFAWVPHWEPYALAVAAIGGVIVAQSALQTGALGTAVGSIESMSVISGSLYGLFLLNEHVGAHSAFEIFAVVFSIVLILWGIIQLSHAEGRMLGGSADPAPTG